ncbi:hypothetical protein [Azospirillum argentinense]|uniref:hypothetical protein n=1 Tax=Azospirillum argentinense TaxID=2970906 RepID=UPI0032DEB42E
MRTLRTNTPPRALPLVAFTKNPSYLDSLRLAVVMGIGYAPLALWLMTKHALGAVALGTLGLVFSLVVWVLNRLQLLVMGLLGRVSPHPCVARKTGNR